MEIALGLIILTITAAVTATVAVTALILVSMRRSEKDDQYLSKEQPTNATRAPIASKGEDTNVVGHVIEDTLVSQPQLRAGFKALDGIAENVRFNLAELQQNFSQARREQSQYFKLTLVFVSFGFLVVIAAIILFLSSQVPEGVASAVGSMTVEVVAALFFKKEKELRAVVARHHEHVISSQKVLTMIETSSLIRDSDERDSIIKEIIFTTLKILPPQPRSALDSGG